MGFCTPRHTVIEAEKKVGWNLYQNFKGGFMRASIRSNIVREFNDRK